MRARELMTQPVVSVHPKAPLSEVARLMVDGRVGCIPVVDTQGKLRGIVAQSDFADSQQGVPFSMEGLLQTFSRTMPLEEAERARDEARRMTAEEVMRTEVITVDEETPIEEVARQMLRYDIEHIPVVRDGVPVGIVARHDFLRIIARAGA